MALDLLSRILGPVTHHGEVGIEIAPEITDHPEVGERVDQVLHRVVALARAMTNANQGAMALAVDGDESARKYFNLSAKYEKWRDYRNDPQGLGLHGMQLDRGEVVRLTQPEVERHPQWQAFGNQADLHPPMRGWLATAVFGADDKRYGLLQLSDKSRDRDFTEEDGELLLELAALTGEALDAIRLVS